MRRSSKKLPKDINQRAAEIVRLSTDDQTSSGPSVKEYLSSIGRKGGLKGGHARAKKLSATKRSDIARKAAKTRWTKQRDLS